jgi:hypothetical protein
MRAQGLKWSMPEGSSSLDPGNVIHYCGQLHPPLALAPLTERLRTKDGFTQPLPCSAPVSWIRRLPALVGWLLRLPGSLWLFADDKWHQGKCPGLLPYLLNERKHMESTMIKDQLMGTEQRILILFK